MPRPTFPSLRNQRIAEQQAVLDRLRSGLGITAKPASPFLAAGRAVAGKPEAMGTVYGAELDGKSVLRMPKGMSQSGFLGPINVAGRTYYPAQSGEDVIFMQGRQYPGGFGRAANAEETDDGRVSGLFRGIAGRDIGGDGRSDEARALASQYAPKPFPMTQEGQFKRYFETPEFNYVFGAQTGKGPKTAAEMATLGTQRQAPTSAPLSDYYRSQSALGRVNQAAIQEMYKDRPDLQQWAAANPMLAQREYTKKYGTTDITKLAPDEENIMGEFGSRAQNETGYKYGFGFPANPVPPTQQPGPGGMDQGERVSYFRGRENIVPLQAMKTTGEGMPAFSTTSGSLSDAADAFVKAMKTKSGAFGS